MAWVNMNLEEWTANLRRDAGLAHRIGEARFGQPCKHVDVETRGGKCLNCLRTVRDK